MILTFVDEFPIKSSEKVTFLDALNKIVIIDVSLQLFINKAGFLWQQKFGWKVLNIYWLYLEKIVGKYHGASTRIFDREIFLLFSWADKLWVEVEGYFHTPPPPLFVIFKPYSIRNFPPLFLFLFLPFLSLPPSRPFPLPTSRSKCHCYHHHQHSDGRFRASSPSSSSSSDSQSSCWRDSKNEGVLRMAWVLAGQMLAFYLPEAMNRELVQKVVEMYLRED